MISDEKILGSMKDALKGVGDGQTELVCESKEFQLTRFAENQIHQNMGRSDSTVWCRRIIENKIGVARTNDISPDGIKKLILDTTDISRNQKADPDFSSLVNASKISDDTEIDNGITNSTPRARAGSIAEIIDTSKKKSLICAGTYEISKTSLAVVNSLGTERFGLSGEFRFTLTAAAENGRSGWAQAVGSELDEFDIAAVSRRAIDKASYSGESASVPDGQYTVILEPDAVANFMLFLGFLGFGAKTLYQKRSFLAGKIGEKIMGENITIAEDPTNPMIRYMPFDYEGITRKQVMLIENGIAKNVVSDSYFARLIESESTGNCLPPDNDYGPYPKAMVLKAGTTGIDEIIKSTNSGIYITRFWYLNFLNPMKTLVTGYTRDGTFLIENGAITRPVVDLRVQQSMLEAFSNAEMISSEQRLIPQYGVMMLAPFMKINNFNLSQS